MAGSLTRYGNILEGMKKNDKWSYDFGLYKYNSPKKQEFSVKIVFGVVVVCCCVVGAFLMTFLLTQTSHQPQTIPLPPQPPLRSPSAPPPRPTTSLPPQTTSTIENTIPIATDTEKLPVAGTLHRITRKDRPNPFTTRLHHPPPTKFTPATPAFPQISQQRNPEFPRSIQDILKYIAANRVKESPRVNRDFFKPSQLHPYFVKGVKLQSRDEDPFFHLKPRDPGDVNLLATASLRFAPPVWRNLNSGSGLKGVVGSETSQVDVVEKKPLTVTLNIYPMDEELAAAASSHRVNVSGAGKQGQKSKRTMKPSKMVIHLNLFSEPPEAVDVVRKKKSASRV